MIKNFIYEWLLRLIKNLQVARVGSVVGVGFITARIHTPFTPKPL